MKNNIVGWFEIPVRNMERAIAFYEQVLDLKLDRNLVGTEEMAWFPYSPNGCGAGGALVRHLKTCKPSLNGVLVYLSSPTGDLKNELSRVEGSGGKIVAEKRIISEEHGYMAIFTDSEGNKIALHSSR